MNQNLVSIGIFGLLGVYSRYFVGLYVSKIISSTFPFATFFINILGAFAIGFIFVIGNERNLISPEIKLGIMVGFLGGFTTFSSYSLETVRLAQESEFLRAGLYLGLSPVLGFMAAFCGLLLARKLS